MRIIIIGSLFHFGEPKSIMALPVYELVELSGVALGAGFMSAMTGGSGMVVLPALLMAGVPPHHALGTNKLYTTGSLLTAAMAYIRRGLFNPILWGMIILATLLGALVGAVMVQLINKEILTKVLPLFIMAVSLYFFFNKSMIERNKQTHPSSPPKKKRDFAYGSLLGLYSGFFGAGTGSFTTAIGISVFKMSLLEASAMSRFLCFVANLVGLMTFMALRRVDYGLGIDLLIFGSIGAYFGAKLTTKMSCPLLRIIIIASSGIMGLILFYKAWFA